MFGVFSRKLRYNNPYTIRIGNKTLFTTRVKYDSWVTEKVLTDGIDNINIPSASEFEITKISDKFNLQGLAKSRWFPELPVLLDHGEAIKLVKNMIPADGNEIVEWMQEMAAMNALLDARMEEYNRYSQLVARAGDGNIPGVYVSDIRFRRATGYYVARNGAVAVSPVETVRIPNRSGKAIIGRNYIGWGGVFSLGHYQWHGILAKWQSLARTPINNRVGFINFHGIIAPNFFVQNPNSNTETIWVSQVYSSPTQQTVKIIFRDPNDYTRVLDDAEIEVGSGQYAVNYTIASYPAVPPVVVEIQPSVSTSLDSFETR